MVSKIKLRRTISVGEKSRVPLGVDGLMDAMRQMYKNSNPSQTLLNGDGFKITYVLMTVLKLYSPFCVLKAYPYPEYYIKTNQLPVPLKCTTLLPKLRD